jgi:hypothetical protein
LAYRRRVDQLEQAARERTEAPEEPDAWRRLKEIAKKGAVAFCKEALGFEPTEYQADFLEPKKEEEKQFTVLVWCRQSGKSFTVAAFLFWFAVEHDAAQIAIVGPSFRQSKLVNRKVTSFLLKQSRDILAGKKPLKTKIALVNGSIIEAYPNNPDTIRGPTLNLIYADEMNFIKDDEEMYDAILFTLGTTNGLFIASSTPWSRDHIFYKMCKDPAFEDFRRLHITWKDAVEPKGPLKKGILEKIKKQLAADPWRWQREMEAEFSEDEDCWLSTSLITGCIDPHLEVKEFDRQHSFWAQQLGPPPG